ncbi:MAG TPA: radical SAM protein [Polyangiales bacterium]|nr:radical SAM protein [Polyangiales bacterium]
MSLTVLLANAPTREKVGKGQERFFVKAGSRWPFSIQKDEDESCRYVPFPFSLAYVAALLERERIAVEVYDGVALNVDRPTFVDRCASYKPNVILMEATTPTIEDDLALCRELKARTGARIALAGAHPTHFARVLLEDNDCVDWVLKGEYELNALAAIRALQQRSPVEVESALAAVPGLVRRGRNADESTTVAVIEGPKGEPIHDLDSLPFPARHMFPTRQAPTMWPYWDGFCQRRPAVQMHSSRGCPFKCTFCLWISVIYEQGPYRVFSGKRIVDEMEHVIATYGAREIYFDDDIFTVREDHVLDVCQEITARGLNVNWSVMGDAMAVTERAIDAMAKAGCIGMKFGVESANKDVLKKLRKPVKLPKVRNVADWCAARGIKTHATITFGLEGDTPATMQETLDFACSLPVDSIQFSVTTPFPGTEHYARASKEKRLIGRFRDFDGAHSSVLRFDNMSAEYVAEFAERAPSIWLRARMSDPAWMSRQVKYMVHTARDQGIQGARRRVKRGVDLLLNRAR